MSHCPYCPHCRRKREAALRKTERAVVLHNLRESGFRLRGGASQAANNGEQISRDRYLEHSPNLHIYSETMPTLYRIVKSISASKDAIMR